MDDQEQLDAFGFEPFRVNLDELLLRTRASALRTLETCTDVEGKLAEIRRACAGDETTEVAGMDFSWALDLLKSGHLVYRSGWSGKGMYVTLMPGYPRGVGINAATAEATRLPEGTVCVFKPYLLMRTADGSFMPWSASQADILAEDWDYCDEVVMESATVEPVLETDLPARGE